jgi:hypothetical protein
MQNRFRHVIRSIALFACAGLTAHAQNIDWGKAVFNSVNNLIDLDGSLFVTTGIVLVAAAAFVKLFWGIFLTAMHRIGLFGAHSDVPFDLDTLIRILFQAWVLTKLLEYWSTPAVGAQSTTGSRTTQCAML